MCSYCKREYAVVNGDNLCDRCREIRADIDAEDLQAERYEHRPHGPGDAYDD